MRESGDQVKTACGNLQLCAVLKAGIEGATHAVGQRVSPGWLTPPPPWSAYPALMACCLVALDKRPGVCPVGIGETLLRALDKLLMRAAGDQAKTECGNLQLCADLEAVIEGATPAVGQRRLERVRERRREEEETEESEKRRKREEVG